VGQGDYIRSESVRQDRKTITLCLGAFGAKTITPGLSRNGIFDIAMNSSSLTWARMLDHGLILPVGRRCIVNDFSRYVSRSACIGRYLARYLLLASVASPYFFPIFRLLFSYIFPIFGLLFEYFPIFSLFFPIFLVCSRRHCFPLFFLYIGFVFSIWRQLG